MNSGNDIAVDLSASEILDRALILAEQMAGSIARAAANYGLTVPRLELLFVLGLEGECKQVELASYLGCSPRQVTALVDGLVASGHVVRTMPPEDRRVRLRVATMPGADPFQLHLFAALAEQERGFVSTRTKAALAQASVRGVRLGGLRDATARRNAAVQAQTRERDRRIGPMIRALRDQGRTLEGIAAQLNAAGVRAPRGGIWHKGTVGRVLRRLEAASAGAESCCPLDTARSR